MREPVQRALLIAGLSNGDEAKGSIVDYLTRTEQAHTIVRYNGGAQAAHNVVDADARHHTFAQFGSGMLIPGTRTFLSRFMLIDPPAMFKEEQHLSAIGVKDAFARTSIDEGALIITPFHQAANRLREIARDENRHGSCGMGVGETMSDFLIYGDGMLLARDLARPSTVRAKLRFLQGVKLAQLESVLKSLEDSELAAQECKVLHDAHLIDLCADIYHDFAEQVAIVSDRYRRELIALPGTMIFEGAQGILLDEWYGFHPYTTWSTTNFKNADELLIEEAYTGEITRIGVMRGYATRHGPGPFVTEDEDLTALLPDAHNETNLWQRQFRIGYLDLVTTRYALDVAGSVDCLAVTNLDRLQHLPRWDIADTYTLCGEDPETLPMYFGLEDAMDGENPDTTRITTIKTIKVRRPPDLSHQERLTALLERCRPAYHTIQRPNHAGAGRQGDLDAYLQFIERDLQRPIALVSCGPTAQDKRTTWTYKP